MFLIVSQMAWPVQTKLRTGNRLYLESVLVLRGKAVGVRNGEWQSWGECRMCENGIVRTMGIILSSGHTPLERCCVHNMSPFVSSSGLSPGNREAKVQRTNVCLNCMEPSVARSSHWSLPVGRYLSDSHYKDRWWSSRGELRAVRPKSCRHLLVTRWESGKQPVVLLTPTFDTWWVYGILKMLHSAHVSNSSRRECR